jgi:hypothetical protein
VSRRLISVAVLVLGSTLLEVGHAGAHSCAKPITVAEGQRTEIEVGVSVGDEPSEDVTFEFAEGFEVLEVPGRPGWDGEQVGNTARFTGGSLDPQGCAVFSVTIRAGEPGTYRVRALQRLGDGRVVEHPPNGDLFAQPDGSYLQVDHSGPPNAAFEQVVTVTPGGESSGAPIGLLAGLTVIGALAGFVLLRRPGHRAPRARVRSRPAPARRR